jgi:serine/threonine protein kinase
MAPADDIENLLAEALARFDDGGEAAMAEFVAAHPQWQLQLERGIRRCREMGLLGSKPAVGEHPERLGEYRLVRRLGGGGMGVVYEAVHEPLGRRVALKIIRPELLFFEGARERFRREVDAFARLEHPSIVPVYASGEHEGVPYFTMELLDGVTVEQATAALRDRDPAELRGADLRALMPVPAEANGDVFDEPWWRLALRVGHQVALAMRHAHLRGIVHRDIKPSNVVVTPHGQAVVLDFGVAQMHAARDLTRSGAAPGSPAFMSPEQRRGLATDERTDVFSLAATLWQLLTLQRPFRDGDAANAVDTLPALARLQRAAPPELDLVLRTAMDADRDRRYRDMASFAADLQAVLERRPIAARPLGLDLRLLRWCQRHRVIAASAAVALVGAAAMWIVLLVVQRDAALALSREQERTGESLGTSLEALHGILVRLGNEQLRTVPLAERVAHGVLQEAADLYRVLLQRHPDNTKVQWQGGQALHALAMSFERQGDTTQALTTVREAITWLGEDRPVSPSALNIRAHAWMSVASWTNAATDKTAAFAAIARAEADFTALEAFPSQRAESLRCRAELQTSLSLLHDETKEPAAVEAALQRGVALQRECMQVGPQVAKDPSLLSLRLCNLGKLYQRQDRRTEARPLFDEALALAKALPAEGTWPPPAIQIAEAQEGIGQLLLRDKDPAAEEFLLASLRTREEAVTQFPNNLEFRIRLGGAMHNFARHVLGQGGRTAEAIGWFEQARDLQQEALQRSPQNVMAIEFLGKHLELIGQCQLALRNGAGVAAAGKALAELPTRSPLVAVRAADFAVRAWMLGGKRDDALLDDAMVRLLAAEERGLRAAQLPAKLFDVMPESPELTAWRTRIAARVGSPP